MNINKPQFYHLQPLLIIIALTVISYYGNSDHELLHWDDHSYITENPWVTNPSFNNIVSLFHEIKMSNWHPLTWLSYIPEYAICNENAQCYKITNITLHNLNSILVFFLFILILNFNQNNRDMNKTGNYSIKPMNNRIKYTSLLAASLFAVHPQHVESVIWIAERKDLLCAFFYLLTIIFHIKNNIFHNGSKLIPFIFFTFALMSKSMAVSLPFILIILDIYYLRFRFERLNSRSDIYNIVIIEKLPYYLFTLIVIIVTLLSQASTIDATISFLDKAGIVLISLFHYLGTFIYPFSLSPFYPAEIIKEYTIIEYVIYLLTITFGFSILIYYKLRKIALILLTYLISIAPVSGIVKIGLHLYADRYTYIPMIGFYLLFSMGIFKIIDHTSKLIERLILLLVVCILLIFSLSTKNYKNMWQDDITLWKYVELKYSRVSAAIHLNLGNSYYNLPLYQKAISEFNIALELEPDSSIIALPTYKNLGLSYEKLNDPEMALLYFSKGAMAFPQFPESHINYGKQLFKQKKYLEAQKNYLKALKILNKEDPLFFETSIYLLHTNIVINQNNEPYLQQLDALYQSHPDNLYTRYLKNKFSTIK